MATEYRLSYTAAQIDEKLGMVDVLSETKLDASALDSIDEKLEEILNNVNTGLPTQEKYITITENGTVEVLPDEGYALSKVTADVSVAGGTSSGDDLVSYIARQWTNFPYDAVAAAGYIGFYAFAGMGFNDSEITLPESLGSSIGDFAFKSTQGINSIVVPDSVSSIGSSAFAESSIGYIKFPANDFLYISDSVCQYCHNLQNVELSNNINNIPFSMFYGCSSLREIALPDSLTEIGQNAFSYSGLEVVTLPSAVNVCDYAFGYCGSLSKVMMPNDVPYIADYAFEGSPNVVIHCYMDSYAEQYAMNHNIPVAYLDTIAAMSIATQPNKTTYPLNGSLNLDGLSLNITLEGGVEKVVAAGYTVDEYDFSTGGTKTITVRYGDFSATFEVFVDETFVEYPESQHPYPDNSDETWYYTHPTEAEALAITFSPETYTESGFDFIYIYDANGNEVGVYSDFSLSGQTIYTMGNSFSIRFTSDSSSNGYGFSITNIEAANASDIPNVPDVPIEEFIINGDGTLTQYNGSGGDVIIPDTVTSINSTVFKDRTDITSVTIANSVVSIGYEAFSGCTGITSVDIPNNVMFIANTAFGCNPNLKYACLPASFNTDVVGRIFAECSGLEYIVFRGDSIPSRLPYEIIGLTPIENKNGTIYVESTSSDIDVNALVEQYKTDPNWSEYADIIKPITDMPTDEPNDEFVVDENGVLIQYNGSGGDVIIPDGVTSIGEQVFSNSGSIVSVNIPEGVTSIGDNAFYNCYNLTNVSIPYGVTSIGEQVFAYCSQLNNIVIPDSVTTIGYGAFGLCTNLVYATLPATVTCDEYILEECENLEYVIIRGDTVIDENSLLSIASSNPLESRDGSIYIEPILTNVDELVEQYKNIHSGLSVRHIIKPITELNG